MSISNDSPIGSPGEDRFGLDPFARAVAQSLTTMSAPEGVVVAISGPWGAGKSSAVNLVRHHLQRSVDDGSLVIVPFNPWWFPGSDALTLSFFQELSAAIGPSLPSKLRNSLAALGQGVSAVGAFAGAIASLGSPGIGDLFSKGAALIGRASKQERTIDEEHRQIAKALREQSKRFVVVVDDIDRLSPDDALTIFRLVKSVGRLPNVIYLLAFDRQIAERIVAERFPSEGPSYLEKIIQRFFPLPPPVQMTLNQLVVESAVKVMGDVPERQVVRFWNVFHDVIAPIIRTPRDVVRLVNHIATGWPAVEGNVDRADFMAISALELAEPDIYARIRANPDRLCGVRQRNDGGRQGDIGQEYDELLGLADRSERDRRRLQIALRRLFPRLDAVWGNTWHAGDEWRRDRQIASMEHFRSYVSFAVSDDVASAQTIQGIVEHAADGDFIRNELVRAIAEQQRGGGTQAALILNELRYAARDIAEGDVTPFVTTLFEVADTLDVDADRQRGFAGMGNNQLRIYWLLNRLVQDRFDQPAREEIYRAAMENASLEWALDFAESCLAEHIPREGRRVSDNPRVSEPVAREVQNIALRKLRAAAEAATFSASPKLVSILFAWWRLNGNDAAEIRTWTDGQLGSDAFVIALAADLPSESWSFGAGWDGLGDRVQRRTLRVNLQPLEDILDTARLETRVADLLEGDTLDDPARATLVLYRDTPRGRHDMGPGGADDEGDED